MRSFELLAATSGLILYFLTFPAEAKSSPLRRHLSKNEVLCVYLKGEQVSLDQDGDHEHERIDYRCEALPESDPLDMEGMVYDIPDNLLLNALHVQELQSGISKLRITGATIYWDQATGLRVLDVDPDAQVEVIEDDISRRLMLRTQGTSSMLMVLVRSADSVNSLAADTVSDRIFGLDRVSLASQYQKCSAGRMNFVPATGSSISNGVGELTIAANVIGSFMTFDIEQQLQAAFPLKFGAFTDYDHILYCMPAGMDSKWIGYTYGRVSRSYYNDDWCGYFSLPFHEIGHNLGLQHSNERGVEYEDRSCMMGKSYPRSDSPQQCFNGVKFTQLNWFPDFTAQVQSLPWTGNIAAFVDVKKMTSGQIPIIVQIGDAFLVFNRAKDHNEDVLEKRDYVTVSQGSATTCDTCVSTMLGGVHETFRAEFAVEVNMASGPTMLRFEACSQSLVDGIDVKKVSVRLDSMASTCAEEAGGANPPKPETESPSINESVVPFIQASAAPSVKASASPSVQTSSAPSVHASAAPSTQALFAPSIKTSATPSVRASFAPSVKASAAPSIRASDLPTAQASVAPSVLPTVKESSEPSAQASSEPSPSPIQETSDVPTLMGSSAPSWEASAAPSTLASDMPSVVASVGPSEQVTPSPSVMASAKPSILASSEPSVLVSGRPSVVASGQPSVLSSGQSSVVASGQSLTMESSEPSIEATLMPSAKTSDEPSIHATAQTSIVVTSSALSATALSQLGQSSNGFCDDSDFGMFFVDSNGQTQRCVWLESRPEYFTEVCSSQEGAAVCPETCGICTDDCDDSSTNFYIGSDIRDCLWLRLRPELKPDLCFPSSDAALHCPETCDICDGPVGPIFPVAQSPPPAPALVEPVVTSVCDDDKFTSFYVGLDVQEFQRCVWLQARPDFQASMCLATHTSNAYSICAETCKKCTDDCVDTNGSFQVGTAIRDCEWLNLRPEMQKLLCLSDHEAWIVCPETCDVCDLPPGESLSPTPAPTSTGTGPAIFCDDEKINTFFVTDLNEFQRCVWLAARPEYITMLCAEGNQSGARETCPETCGVCTDDCEDTGSKFDVGDDVRDCLWLSLRPTMQNTLCKDTNVALACPETCNICDARVER